MLVEETKTQITQYPETEGNWLYKDYTNAYTGEITRQFGTSIKHEADQPLWLECTPAEKQAWEAAHSTETYGDRVSRLIHEKYDVATETACINNYLLAMDETSSITEEERTKYINYYNEYQAYRAECKERAKDE